MCAKLSSSVIENVRANTDIVELISSYIQLRRTGSTFKALCPFHKEKTPSFIVNQQRQFYHCFGCGASGDVFRFVMDYEKVTFIEAVEMLAHRAGIALSLDKDVYGKSGISKERLYKLLKEIAQFYYSCLTSEAKGHRAVDYLRQRNFTDAVIKDFSIGYAPAKWDSVLQWAKGNYSQKELQYAGLIITKDQNTQTAEINKNSIAYDRFRDRIMFPIFDEQSRIIGFSGRSLNKDDHQGAKYINSPETPVFHKSKVLYGLHKARKPIVSSNYAVICEGQIDVIRCHISGFDTAVAAQGTAFGYEHARIIKRYADNIFVAFDPDEAGQKAALTAIKSALKAGLSVKIVDLPDGNDPDALLQTKQGKEIFENCLDKAKSIVDYQLMLLKKNNDLSSEAGVLRASSAVMEIIDYAGNAIQQSLLVKEAADKLSVPEESLKKEFSKRYKKHNLSRGESRDKQNLKSASMPMRELALTEHLVKELSLSSLVEKYLPLALITHPTCRKLIESCIKANREKKNLDVVVSSLDNESRDMSVLLSTILSSPQKVKGNLYQNIEAVKSLILCIRREFLQKKRNELAQKFQKIKRNQKQSNFENASERELYLEYSYLRYDIEKLKDWDSAVEIMEIMKS
jgi:DNA primase